MHIKGFQKTTLLDFPGRVACTVFTGGCNFRCPFCHNASLVLGHKELTDISEDDFFKFLQKRKGILDGVCITGGEPLMQGDIIDFISKIRSEGFAVKLDTNGAYTDTLAKIVSLGAVDYIAMDIKNSQEKYALTTGLSKMPDGIFDSIQMIMQSDIPYEFRTTVVKELHTIEDIKSIANTIKGAKHYYLQCFKPSDEVIKQGLSAPSLDTLKEMQKAAFDYVEACELRGV